jgi:hypothetical protein
MFEEIILQGRKITENDIKKIKQLILENPNWGRTRLSRELCRLWDWRSDNGQLKDMACRSFLRKLDQQKHIQLPKPIRTAHLEVGHHPIQSVFHNKTLLECSIKELYPIIFQIIEKGYELKLFKYLISAYHYLGWSRTVGENLKYLIFDKNSRVLGCVMFGAAAWRIAPRDDFIGWANRVREKNLSYIVNNNRFLILPFVKVKHLASHVLGQISRRICQDWMNKYHHPVYLLETFVDNEKFKGTCYRAANWTYVGNTKGRGKLDRKNLFSLSVKSIYLYPLSKTFRRDLERNQ